MAGTEVGIAIRAAGSRDAPVLTEIAHAAKRHWGYPEELIRLWDSDLSVTPAFIESHPVYCAVDGRTILGFYALAQEGAVFELEHLWVRPQHLRAGIGTRLFAHAVRTVRSAGGTILRVASDPNAEGFYRRMGARRVGDIPARPLGRTLPLLVVELGYVAVGTRRVTGREAAS
jgi:GNAT superfamily N-acetyltransferase